MQKPVDSHSFKEPTAVASNEQQSQFEIAAPPVPVLDRDHQPVVRVRDIEAEKPQVGSRQRKNEFEPYLNGEITNISQYTAAHVEYPRRPTKIQKFNDNNDEKAVNIPSLIKAMPYSYDEIDLPEWFNYDLIHDLERLALPEFFTGDNPVLTPDSYKMYRDYMMMTYKSNPDYYLTISACKAKLDVDLVTLVRVHSFLESYNLINSRPDPRRRIFDPYIDSDPSAQIKPGSQRNFKDIEGADIDYLRKLIYDETQVAPIRSAWDLSVEDPNNPDGRKIFHCSNCQVDCSEIRYQSLKCKNFQVCIDCFLEGRFPATLFSGDFLRMEGGDDLEMEEEWTDDEILHLLEGVERFEDDWLLISEHVGSRSKEQCITKFLQLPINDEFLTAQLSKKELEELPFGDLPNPVMTTIAFLSGHINPGVGAAAAKTALKELMKSGEGHTEAIPIIKNEESVDVDMDADMDIVEVEEENDKTGIFSKELMKKATTSALKTAVENARKLASYEDEEIQHWTRLAVKTMVDKLSFKVQQYDELEASLENELTELEKQQDLLATSIEAISTQHFPLHGSGESNSIQPQTTEVTNDTPGSISTSTTLS
ncbi:uncharacterized protein EV154DRAFT_419413 [Mucor mucedo]|uniref:uncharacterized protein n=1 Tax=Mucor mucedo TaxID=29922 RepID=UPI00221F7BD7|nr:uncharacterized protein EV154DRAFT_419413 [Mucor mucedo]KAI7892100.1 hypothetical protein EV154DRAFT_419413 [Mucor mucedo]